MQAFDNANRHEFAFIGGAGSSNAMQWIKDGKMEATVIYPPTQAADGVRLARLLVQQKGLSDLVQVEVPAAHRPQRPRGDQGERRQVPAARLQVLTDPPVRCPRGRPRIPRGHRPRTHGRRDRRPTTHGGRVHSMSTHDRPTLGIGMIGYSFMGLAHSQGWRNARSFFDPALTPELVAIGGRDAAAAGDVARRFGWHDVETDWRALIARDDVDLVDICTPGDTHAEIAIAALAAGKHVLCEKPLANTVEEAVGHGRGRAAARADGIRSMVGFTYRRVPAIAHARNLVQDGRIGEIRHVRAQYLQDWLTDPESPLTWRLQKDRAGSGALGDIGAHIIDLTQFITGEQLAGVSAITETFVKERPLPGRRPRAARRGERGPRAGHRRRRRRLRRPVQRRRPGDLRGHPLRHRSQERDPPGGQRLPGQHRLRLRGHERAAVLRRVRPRRPRPGSPASSSPSRSTPTSAAGGRPVTASGYEHGFTHQAVDLLEAIAEGRDPEPSFDGRPRHPARPGRPSRPARRAVPRPGPPSSRSRSRDHAPPTRA